MRVVASVNHLGPIDEQLAEDLWPRLPRLPGSYELYGPLLRPDSDVNALAEFTALDLNGRLITLTAVDMASIR